MLDEEPSQVPTNVSAGPSSSVVPAPQGGHPEGQTAPLPSDVLDLREKSSEKIETFPMDVLGLGEDEELVLSPTKELKVMGEDNEQQYWKKMWRECENGLSYSLESGTSTDEGFSDRKMKAILQAKECEYRMFDSHLIQCFPLNTEQRTAQRELAWVTMRTLIRRTPHPRRAEENRRREAMSFHGLASKMSEVYMQYSGNEKDVRGTDVLYPRPAVLNQKLYATVIRDGTLPEFTELSANFTEENKGDVLETLMGLNFLEKDHRLTCEDLGITSIHDAQETLLRVEWYTFRRAIVAMREACANYRLYVGDAGMSLGPVMPARRCLGCGKKRSNNKRTQKLTSYRQWPVGGIWDLEIMACALSGVFSTLIPQLVTRLKNGAITVVPTTKQWEVMNDLIAGQMRQYADAVENSQQPDCNMPSIYRRLRDGMDARIEKIATQPNYGRGIPVLVCGYELSPITMELLGYKARSVEREELHRHNMAVLQELDNPALTKEYNNQMANTTKFLAVVTEKEDGVVGVLASTPAHEPQIIEQTRRKVGVTLTPGPAVSSKEFADVDLVLVDQARL
eukprot:5443276-Amphidinium_carterae.6